MPRKTKVGKQRQDKYYQLAKETGYRSRAAFKLLQLNRKFGFLERSQVLVDLCAAPGGWLQVAAQQMPVSNLIIGVDLVPIRPISNAICLQEDIRRESCRWAIAKELKTWKADCVLNDGAPNVGKNWLHDAFSQAQLTLSALKLSTSILRKGGWFVTKVFRSKDYPALLLVFKKLFKKVHVTKPQASRNESAEIFVVCQGYLKPEKLDPSLLDVKTVFQELHLDPEKRRLNLLHPEKKRVRAEGYAEGDFTQYHPLTATEFLRTPRFLEALGRTNEIVLDDPLFSEAPATTTEIRHCLEDVQVLGRRELRLILNWRKQMLKILKEADAKAREEHEEEVELEPEDGNQEQTDGLEEDEESSVQRRQKAAEKKLKKKETKDKRRKQKRLALEMEIPGDRPDFPDQDELFSLGQIRRLQTKPPSPDDDKGEDQPEMEEAEEMEENVLVDEESGLSEEARREWKTRQWFQRETLADVENEDDEDYEVEVALKKMAEKRGGKSEEEETRKRKREDGEESFPASDLVALNAVEDEKSPLDEVELVPREEQEESVPKRLKLDAEGLALGSMLIHSSKSRKEIIEEGFNRYAHNDTNLPSWFVDDENKHFRKTLPISKETLQEYRSRLKAIDARPIKKVAEAKARKKKKLVAKKEKARRMAEAVVDNPDMNQQEKAREYKKISKQSGRPKKKPPTIVVSRKFNKGAGGRPSGVKGRFKRVDPRMKKDLRKDNNKHKSKKEKLAEKGRKKQKQNRSKTRTR